MEPERFQEAKGIAKGHAKGFGFPLLHFHTPMLRSHATLSRYSALSLQLTLTLTLTLAYTTPHVQGDLGTLGWNPLVPEGAREVGVGGARGVCERSEGTSVAV